MEYTKIGFYDNETQTWSDWFAVEVGHEGNFVYDKTTDSAKVNFYSSTNPKIKINQWAFLGHFSDNITTTLTYNNEGLPANHEQYIVAKFEKQKQKNGKWLNTMALIEPIEAMRGIVTETLSFTNQTEKVVEESGVDVIYIKGRYNCLTALERVLKVTPANNDLTKSWWARINILDSEWLETIPFDDDTFTAGDLFTILFKLDDIVDRTPVIYFDMANLGATKKYLLKFDRKDGFDKEELDYDDLITDNIGLSESDSIDTYATGIVSEVDNLTTNNIMKFPNTNLWAVPQYDTDDRAVPAGDTEKGNFYIKLPTKIRRINIIKKLYVEGADRQTDPDPRIGVIRRLNETINDKYILEKQNYLASEFLEDPAERDKCFWFEQGTDKLYVNEYYSKEFNPVLTPPNYNTNLYYIEYEPLIDNAMQYGDSEYQNSINQTDSQIESLKYTKFLENYLKGMNKSDILFIKIYYDFSDFKDLIGSSVIKDNEEYIISNISYKNANQLYVVAFQLNKSNLRRNANIKANEQIKANKAIDYKNLKDRRSRYVDFIKIDTDDTIGSAEYLTNKLIALSALIPTQISSALCPQVALFRAKGTLTKQDLTTATYSNEYLMNIAKIVNKGQVQYNFKTLDNAQIGTRKIPNDFEGEVGGGLIQYYSIFGDVAEQIPILYTDAFGEVQQIDYIFSNIDEEEFDDIDPIDIDTAEYNRTYKMLHTMANLPIIPAEYRDALITNKVFEINDINKFKDMLELENDNFIFNVASDNKNIIVCQALLELSRLVQPVDNHDAVIMVYTEKKNENDIFGASFIPATKTYDGEKITFEFDTETFTQDSIKSFVIFSLENDNLKPMLIINNPNETDIRNGFINIYY